MQDWKEVKGYGMLCRKALIDYRFNFFDVFYCCILSRMSNGFDVPNIY